MPQRSNSQAPLLDVSLPLSPRTIAFPGDPVVEIEMAKGAGNDDDAVVHRLCMGSHAGTHLDAPAHVIRGGLTLAEVGLEPLIGECTVVDCTQCGQSIDAAFLRKQEIPPVRRVLLKTRNSALLSATDFDFNYVYLTPDGARFLVELGASLVGIDYLSIGQMGPLGVKTHKILLANQVLILEGLDLSQVAPGGYELLCLPLKLDVPDGAPVRALLRPLKEAADAGRTGLAPGRESRT